MTESTAHKAITRWPISAKVITLAAHRENIVYRVEAASGENYALRLHRAGYHSRAALESELQWMAALADRGIRVPKPSLSHHAQYIEEIDGIHVDILSWMPGHAIGSASTALDLQNRSGTFFQLGAALARLHTASDDWQPPQSFVRHAWDTDGLLGETPFWGRFWDNPHLADNERDLMASARDAAQSKLQEIAHDTDYGLIHADAVRENVLLHDNDVCLIDFDDGGYGFRLFDLATVLLKCRLEPDLQELQQSLISGYHSERALDVEHLDFFVALRSFTYVGWIVPRLNEPWAPARLQRFKQDALHHATRLLPGQNT
jgi:Ser/Thr protein kinase RdoA (MazF antagonist)